MNCICFSPHTLWYHTWVVVACKLEYRTHSSATTNTSTGQHCAHWWLLCPCKGLCLAELEGESAEEPGEVAIVGGCASRHGVLIVAPVRTEDLLDWPCAIGSPLEVQGQGCEMLELPFRAKALLAHLHGHGKKRQHAFVGLGCELTCLHRTALRKGVCSGTMSPPGLSLLWPFCLPEAF